MTELSKRVFESLEEWVLRSVTVVGGWPVMPDLAVGQARVCRAALSILLGGPGCLAVNASSKATPPYRRGG